MDSELYTSRKGQKEWPDNAIMVLQSNNCQRRVEVEFITYVLLWERMGRVKQMIVDNPTTHPWSFII